MSATPTNLLGLPRIALETFFEQMEEKSFRAEQTLKWIHQFGVMDFDAMTNLSRALREKLRTCAEVRAPKVLDDQTARDGTRKWLLEVDGSNGIETVFIPEPERGTLCVSSQVGCALNCSFCSTARQGFNRNLSAAEIVGQLWLADRLLSPPDKQAEPSPTRRTSAITNVVMMGMGEPLLNFDAVSSAMQLMLEDCAYNLARRRVTLSTAGVVPGIYRLAESCPVALAISLHATTAALRDQLVPINRKYPIAELLDACRAYAAATPKHHITFEYVMLDGVNDSDTDARRLRRLLSDIPAKVNLIPFNPFPHAPYQRSSHDRIARFREVLTAGGLIATTRRPRGDDIDAACGQLAGRVVPRGRNGRGRATVPAPSLSA